MWYNYLIPPVVGAIIGYFTNELAIKMLFRPKTPKYIFGMRVPFTPGIIPKEKSRIATAIGETISKNLMDKDTMTKSLLSEEMILKLSNAIDTFVNTQKENSEDVRTFLSHYINLEDMDKMVTEASDKFSQNISTKIANSNDMEQSKNSLLGLFGTDKIIQLLSKPTERILSKHIGNILSNNAKEIISPMVDGQVNSFLETPVCDFIQGREERIEKIKTMILDAYKNIISNQLPRILESIDIKKIVEDRINEMKIEETEQLTYGVVSNELRAIVLLGALLGGIIGLANLAFI